MSRNLTQVPASVFALRAFVAANALTLSGAFYTGHDGLWSLSILLSLAILAAISGQDAQARIDQLFAAHSPTPVSHARSTLRSSSRQRAPSAPTSTPLLKPFPPMPQPKKTPTMAKRNPVMLTQEDYKTLQPLTAGASPADEMTLAHELARAIIVKREALPPHTVRLASKVTVKDLDTAREMSFSIVMPAAADMRQNKISILTPMGTALIGFRAGEEVEWKVPAGIKRFKIVDVVNKAAA